MITSIIYSSNQATSSLDICRIPLTRFSMFQWLPFNEYDLEYERKDGCKLGKRLHKKDMIVSSVGFEPTMNQLNQVSRPTIQGSKFKAINPVGDQAFCRFSWKVRRTAFALNPILLWQLNFVFVLALVSYFTIFS